MKNIEINRLYRGMVDVRNYVLNDCIEKKESIKITVSGKSGYMILEPSKFKEKAIKISKQTFKSQFDKKEYKLVSFKWEPQNE